LKEDYVFPKVNDPRILPIVTKILKEAIGNHALKDCTETRHLCEQKAEYFSNCDEELQEQWRINILISMTLLQPSVYF
jgi:predicted HD phosphohydrolase